VKKDKAEKYFVNSFNLPNKYR